MNKKLLVSALIAIMAVMCALAFAACGDKHTHEYTDNVVSPTCTEAGYTEHKCSCGDSYRDNEVAAHHTLTFTAEKTSTCTEAGHMAYFECSKCQKWFYDENGYEEIENKDDVTTTVPHNLDYVEEKEATCAETGHMAYFECSECQKWFYDENSYEEIENKDDVTTTVPHDLFYLNEKAATCIEEGNIACYVCTACQKYFSDANAENEVSVENIKTAFAPHTLSKVNEQPATCTEQGNLEYYTCSVCEKLFEDENGKTEITDYDSVKTAFAAHTLSKVNKQPATCTEQGNSEYYTCSVCTKWFWDENGQTEITDKQSVVITVPHNFVSSVCTICGTKQPPTEGIKYTSYNATYAYVSGIGTATDTDLVIADKYEGLPVTSIGSSAFKNCKIITSIVIPDSVTSIGESAFSYCTGLTSVTIGSGVTSIGSSAFYGCNKLKSVYYNGTVDQWVQIDFKNETSALVRNLYINNQLLTEANITTATEIKKYAFYNYSGLKSVTIGNSVTSIGDWAFYSCNGLTSLTIPDSVTSIGRSTFDNCTGLTSLTIGNGVTSIGNYAFEKCRRLTSITIPDNVRSIGIYAFWGCSELTSVTIGNGVTSLNSYIFYECSKLTSITIGNSVTSIGEHAFWGCSELTNVIIPDSVTSIDWCAFYECSKLTSITIGNSVEGIGRSAFKGCTRLTSVTIPNSVTGIGVQAFYGCSKLTSITIGNSVTSIGASAFEKCTNLASVTIPNSVTSLGEKAFYDCHELASVTIGNGVKSIGKNVFYECLRLASVTIGTSVTSISYDAFDFSFNIVEVYNQSALNIKAGSTTYGNIGRAKNIYTPTYGQSKLSNINGYMIYTDGTDKILVAYLGQETELVLPEDITKIKQYAFYQNENLVSVTIPDSVTSIDREAFYGCSGLTNVSIGNGVTSIGVYSFGDCSGLTSIVIPDSVTNIGSSAFRGCSGLTSITLPFVGATAGVTSADANQYPFGYIFGTDSYAGGVATEQSYYGSSTSSTTSKTYYIPANLKSVTITGGGEILSGAFYNCTGITSVTIGNGVTSITDSAFYNCNNLLSLIISDSVTSVGSNAFNWCNRINYVYFKGTEAEWNTIAISTFNGGLTNATRYYYSETEPAVSSDGTAYDGNYWHYDGDGNVVVWKKQ